MSTSLSAAYNTTQIRDGVLIFCVTCDRASYCSKGRPGLRNKKKIFSFSVFNALVFNVLMLFYLTSPDSHHRLHSEEEQL